MKHNVKMTPELIFWPSHDKEEIPSSESLEWPGEHYAKCNKPGTDSQMHVLIYMEYKANL